MKKSILLILLIITGSICHGDTWTQKANFGGTPRTGPVFFSINGKGYMGAGMDSYPTANYRKDFWEYDPVTDIWTQKADFGGTARYTMVGCSAGGYGYAGTGKEHSSTALFNDFWRYDPIANIWTQLNNFPGVGRQASFVMTINDRIYAGMGRSSVAFLNDWYMYNDTTDTWTPRASFPGTPRSAGFGFCINGKGYLGAGMVTYSPLYTTINDCWEYDPIMNLWVQVADFPGTARFNTIGFAVNNKGYAGVGSNVSGGISVYYSDFYEYDAGLNTWTQKANFPSQEIASGGFVINNRGYAGCGLIPPGVLSNYFWEYTPDSLTSITEASPESAITILPNPLTDALIISGPDLKKIEIFNIYGAVVYSGIFETNQREPRRIDVGFLPTGSYFLKTGDVMKKFVKL